MSSFQTCMTDWLLWNTKEGILKNIGNQIDLVPTEIYYMDKSTMQVKGIKTLWFPTFFRLSSFVFCIKKKVIQVWNDDMRVSKWWQNHFICGWTITLRDELSLMTLGIIVSQVYCISVKFNKSTSVFLIVIYDCAYRISHIRRYVRHPLVFSYVSGPKAEADDIEWKENQACRVWPAIEWFNLSHVCFL